MPKLLYARPPANAEEEQKIRKLAGSRHAPGDWIMRAKMIVASWDGERTSTIAARLGCHMQTVRERLARFNAEGLDGLGDRPGAGRKPRITEDERGRIIALARADPPGRPVRDDTGELSAADETGPPQWTLNTLTETAQAEGIQIQRSQVRRILLAEKVRWRHTRSWAASQDPDFVPQGRRSSSSTPTRRPTPR
ncbi:helix-turn-helix domain-containing protein [Candidatus Protofrankia californiensis]|uniref:helix-turn-helix domain-containing protein n=1 Tax=Candidatus Protofrankia californiensis TaxID=1839754 RepID=UPI001041A544|nr:helix-turn-helix domain-containing protein [Candidatus Protofrankia californiensis]